MLNENVKKLLKENMWDLATCAAGVPNVVPVAFKDVTDDGKLVVGDAFLDTTLRNLAANDGRIAISVYDARRGEQKGPVTAIFHRFLILLFLLGAGAGRGARCAPASAHLHLGRDCGML